MKQFKAESGIPIPERRRKSRFSDIPFSEIKVGESVLLDNCSRNNQRKYKNIYSSVYKLIRSVNPDGVFKIGVVFKKENKMEIRLWRIE